MSVPTIPVAVVGSGPYGLSVAAHLAGSDVEHRVFGRPMSLWAEHMPRGMYLKSEGHASNLSDPAGKSTLRHYCEEHGLPYADLGLPVALDSFLAYGHWFQQREVPHLEQEHVLSLTQADRGFTLGLPDGSSFTAERVVLAVGVEPFAHVPEVLADLPTDRVTHTSAHADLSRFAGRDVVVVGAGQSALETAALLAEAGARPQLLARADTVVWNPTPSRRGLAHRMRHPVSALGYRWPLRFYAELPGAFPRLPARRRVEIVRTVLGPAGSWWLRDRIEGTVPVTLASHIAATRFAGDTIELTVAGPDGATTLHANHIIAGTGYRVDLARLGWLEPELRRRVKTLNGYPVLSRSFESSVPGLYVVGLAAAVSFGPVQRFVYGADFAARRVAAAVSPADHRVRGRLVPAS